MTIALRAKQQPHLRQSQLPPRYPSEPLLEEVLDMMSASGLTLLAISVKANVALSTLYRWTHRGVRRPQIGTVRAVARVCGWQAAFVRWEDGHWVVYKNSSRGLIETR